MITDADWDAVSGVSCPKCHHKVVRVRDGLCLTCAAQQESARLERVARRQEKQHAWREIMSGHMTLTAAKKGKSR